MDDLKFDIYAMVSPKNEADYQALLEESALVIDQFTERLLELNNRLLVLLTRLEARR